MAARKAPAKKVPTPSSTPKPKRGLSTLNPAIKDPWGTGQGTSSRSGNSRQSNLINSNAKGFVVGRPRRNKKK
jgi:hypothetical protein